MRLPMRPLEFDILAHSFADGFSRALTDLLGASVTVGVRLRSGHLETINAPGSPEARSTHLGYSFDYVADWHRRVQPIVDDHVQHLARVGFGPVSAPDACCAASTGRSTMLRAPQHCSAERAAGVND